MGVPGAVGPMVSATGVAPMTTGGAAAMPATTAVPPAPPVAASQTYKVQHGDSLAIISEHFYKTQAKWQLIYNANKDKIGPNPSKLKEGMELVIPDVAAATATGPAPAAGGTGAAAAGSKYVVASGDTLTSIAQKQYGSATPADIARIYQANKAKIGPDPDDLKVGMEIVIPAAH
jgi:nucleoid-associated protein YgaU